MQLRAASVVGSGASLVAGIAVPIAFPHIDPWVGKGLLIVALALLMLAIGLYWPHRKSGGNGETSVTTLGPHSPGFGSVGRDVHFHNHPTPAATQERKSPYGSAHGAADRAERLAAMHSMHESLRAPARRDTMFTEALLFAATGRWDATLDDVDSDTWQERKREMEQLAADGELAVWGKPFSDSPVAGMIDEVYQPIGADFWRDRTVNWLHLPYGRAQTEERNPSNGAIREQYHELMVSKAEIERRFSQLGRTTNEGRP